MKALAGGLGRDQAGVVGKIIVVWLLAIMLFGIAGIDTVSVLLTKLRVSDVASNAASEGANRYRDTKSPDKACEAAKGSVAVEDAEAKIPLGGCVVNVQTGRVQITVRKTADTLVAGRFGFTKKLARVSATETNGPTTL